MTSFYNTRENVEILNIKSCLLGLFPVSVFLFPVPLLLYSTLTTQVYLVLNPLIGTILYCSGSLYLLFPSPEPLFLTHIICLINPYIRFLGLL
jgi:hypothetical protein